ncbi:MAG: hypothetical protein IIW55_05500 [Bacteroidales bacterium]|nr:hypothetical protein [Bacteroidales bacterium]
MKLLKKVAAISITTLILSVLSFSSVNAQSRRKDEVLFKRFETHFKMMDTLIFRQVPATTDFGLMAVDTVSQSQGLNTMDSLIDAKVESQQRALKAETGLVLSGQTYYRAGQELGFDSDEDDAVAIYSVKAQAELRWNIMNSSLINRKEKLKELSLMGELERVALEQEYAKKMVERQKEYLRKEYDSLLMSVLKLRVNNLQLLTDAQMYLVSDRSIGTDELLKLMDEQAIAERLLETMPKDYPIASQLVRPLGGEAIQIDTARLKSYIRENALPLHMLDLQIEILQQKEESAGYWTSLGFSPFLRYSYYMRPEMKNSSNLDVGLSFQIPLSAQESRKKKALTAECLQKTMEKEEQAALLMENVELILLELERANRGLAGELKRIEVLRDYMKLRRENYQGHIGEYNFLSRIKEYNHYLTCWENYYSYQYKRDCCIADLQVFLLQQSIFDFVLSKNENR